MAATDSGVYSVLDDERINGRSEFFKAMESNVAGDWTPAIVEVIESNSEIENYNWLGTSPKMEIWEGPAPYGAAPNFSATLQNKDFFAGEEIAKGDIRRDKTGQVRKRLQSLGASVALWPSEEIINLLSGAETASGTDLSGKAWDGQAFYDTDHTYAGADYTTNQTNDISSSDYASLNTASATAPTADEMADVLVNLFTHFYTLKDDRGRPINGGISGFQVVVGTGALAAAAMSAVGLQNLTSGASNPLAGMVSRAGVSVDVKLDPRLSAKTTKVYVNALGGNAKPFIYQDEVGLELFEHDPGKDHKYLKIGAKRTGRFGYGHWQKSLVGTLS